MRTIVGLYDKFEDAQKAVKALNDAGFDKNQINLIAHDAKGKYSRQMGSGEKQDLGNGTAIGAAVGGIGGLLIGLGALAIPGIGPVIAAGPIAAALAGAGVGAAGGALVGALVDLGIPEDQSHYYAEGVRRGGTLVTVQTEDQRAQEALEIMNRFNPADVNQRAAGWKQDQQWNRFDESGQPYTEEQLDQERQRYTESVPTTGGEMNIPVVEEDVEVGKREVDRGGVRIHSYETQRPVEQDVTLRKEQVNVERTPVDRPATEEDLNAFKEGTMDVTETEEVPTVKKTARVVEEVHVNKNVNQETETVRDTARRTNVDVEHVGPDWQQSQNLYQQHFRSNYKNSRHDFNYYSPAYRYGFEMRNNSQYRGKTWDQVESDARMQWERSGRPGSWEEFKDAIRYGYEG